MTTYNFDIMELKILFFLNCKSPKYMVKLFALSIFLKSLHSFENSVDTDQVASDDKVELSQFITIHSVFHPCDKSMYI